MLCDTCTWWHMAVVGGPGPGKTSETIWWISLRLWIRQYLRRWKQGIIHKLFSPANFHILQGLINFFFSLSREPISGLGLWQADGWTGRASVSIFAIYLLFFCLDPPGVNQDNNETVQGRWKGRPLFLGSLENFPFIWFWWLQSYLLIQFHTNVIWPPQPSTTQIKMILCLFTAVNPSPN